MDRIEKVQNWLEKDLHVDYNDKYGNNLCTFDGKHKPYYLVCWWGEDMCGEFVSMEGIKTCIREKVAHSYEESWDIVVYRVKDGKTLYPEIKSLTVKLSGIYCLNKGEK